MASERLELVVAFGERVKGLREQQGLSRGELAGKCGIHESVLDSVELGLREPRLQMVAILAAGLGMAGYELLRLAEQKQAETGR